MKKIIMAIIAIISIIGCSSENKTYQNHVGIYFQKENNCTVYPPVNDIFIFQKENELNSILILTEIGYDKGDIDTNGNFDVSNIPSELNHPNSSENCSGQIANDIVVMTCDKVMCDGIGENCKSQTCEITYKLCENCGRNYSYPEGL